MMFEEWRDIKDFKGYYQVSNLGNVKRIAHYSNYKGKSLRYMPERIKLQNLDKNGYKVVMLYKGTMRKLCKVHRLVAEAFIPNPNNLPQVNHKDEDKSNNQVTNLEFCDAFYNDNYGTRNKRMSETKKRASRVIEEKEEN